MSSPLPHQTRQLLYDLIPDLDQKIDSFRKSYSLKANEKYRSKDITHFIDEIFELHPALEDHKESVDVLIKELIFRLPVGSVPKIQIGSRGAKILTGSELLGALKKGVGRVDEKEIKDSVVIVLNKSANLNTLKQILKDKSSANELDDLLHELADGRDVLHLEEVRKNADRDRVLFEEHMAGRITARGLVKSINGNRDKGILSIKAQNIIANMSFDAIEQAIKREKNRRRHRGGT